MDITPLEASSNTGSIMHVILVKSLLNEMVSVDLLLVVI